MLRDGSSLREVLRNRDNSGTEDERWRKSEHVARFLASMQKEGPETHHGFERLRLCGLSGARDESTSPPLCRTSDARAASGLAAARPRGRVSRVRFDSGAVAGLSLRRKALGGIPATGRSAKWTVIIIGRFEGATVAIL